MIRVILSIIIGILSVIFGFGLEKAIENTIWFNNLTGIMKILIENIQWTMIILGVLSIIILWIIWGIKDFKKTIDNKIDTMIKSVDNKIEAMLVLKQKLQTENDLFATISKRRDSKILEYIGKLNAGEKFEIKQTQRYLTDAELSLFKQLDQERIEKILFLLGEKNNSTAETP